jgi:hypothetical protein
MLNRLKQLEQASAELDPSASQRGEMTTQALDYAESFLYRLPKMNAFEPDMGRSKLLEQAYGEEAGDFASILATLDTAVNCEGINAASGGQMGYIPGGGVCIRRLWVIS